MAAGPEAAPRTEVDAHDEVCREVVLPVSPDEAWELVTDPAHLAHWFAPDVELELHEGGRAAFRWEDGHERRGVVEEVVPSERLAFRWRTVDDGVDGLRPAATRVLIELAPVPAGTRLIVRERGFSGVAAAAQVPGCALVARWAWELRLATCLRLLVPVAV
jgi:uncharacterized protein YndB with AHSA1/START domain